MNSKIVSVMLVLILIGMLSLNHCPGVKGLSEDFLFINAKWGSEETDVIASPGSINVITVYITPTVSNGVKNIVAELTLPHPLKGLDGSEVVKTSYLTYVPKGQIIPLMFKVIIPANVSSGNYEFSLKINYTVLSPALEERTWRVKFTLPITEKPSILVEMLSENLEKGTLQEVRFKITYLGSEYALIHANLNSEVMSILDYEPKTSTLVHNSSTFTVNAKVYVPLEYQASLAPITLTISYETPQYSSTFTKTYLIPLVMPSEPDLYLELLNESIKRGTIQNVLFKITYKGTDKANVKVDFNSEVLSILDYEPKETIQIGKEGSFYANVKIYCPLEVSTNMIPLLVTVIYETAQTSRTITKTYILPLKKTAEITIVELQPTISEGSIIVKGQLINIGDSEAKYITVYARSLTEGLKIDTPTTYLGSLSSGEGVSFFVYATPSKPNTYDIEIQVKYYGPEAKWHTVLKNVTVSYSEEIAPPKKTTEITSEIVLLIVVLAVISLIIGIIIGRYMRWKGG